MAEGFLEIMDITAPTEVSIGETINVKLYLKNIGGIPDDFMWEAIENGTTTVLGSGIINSLTNEESGCSEGDINYDGVVDSEDMDLVEMALGSQPGDPNWNPRADVNDDGVVDIQDIVAVSAHVGETCTISNKTTANFSFIMPNKDITINIKTYHLQELLQVIFRQNWHPGDLIHDDGNWVAIDLTGDGTLNGAGYDGYSSYKPLPENIIGYTVEGYPVYTRPGYEPTERIYILEDNLGVIFKMSDPDAANAILSSEPVSGYEDREVYAS